MRALSLQRSKSKSRMLKSSPEILDDQTLRKIASSSEAEKYLILGQHPDFRGFWQVNSLGDDFLTDLKDYLGSFQTISPARLEEFISASEERGYKLVFEEEPEKILEVFEGLNKTPEICLNSDLSGNVNGLLPFQVQGYNYLKDLESGFVLWQTGTGKSIIAVALLKYHMALADYDLALFVVKGHNKINIQRTLLRQGDIEAIMLDGPKKYRKKLEIDLRKAPSGTVVVTNYEKLRVDYHDLKPLFENKRILLLLDEAPMKLKSRQTKLYKAVRMLLYKKANLSELRPSHLRQYVLTATPIENSPEDFYSVCRLLEPNLFGTVADFRNEYVKSYGMYGTIQSWKNLDRMGMKASHLMHQVDKSIPEIASQFPKVLNTDLVIDWHQEDRVIYDMLTDMAKTDLDEEDLLGLIMVLQMMCNAPSTVSRSAHIREWAEEDGLEIGSKVALKFQQLLTRDLNNNTHTKLVELVNIIISHTSQNEKIVVFSAFNQALLPTIEQIFIENGISYVIYNGNIKQKQEAQDRFQNDPSIQVFLSSDQGSDSISLEEASVVINFDLPWKHSTLIQRQNRIHRITSEHKTIRVYTLMMANSVEDRKLKIINKKKSYYDQVFQGVADQGESMRMSREDLIYVLTGEIQGEAS